MTDQAKKYAFPHAGLGRASWCLARGIPERSLAQGRAVFRQIRQLGLEDTAADAELDIVQPDFLGCGFAFIGAWGRRPAEPRQTGTW
jgi:hypothetical protein